MFGIKRRQFSTNAFHVSCLAIARDGKHAVSGETGSLSIWDLGSRLLVRSIDLAPLYERTGRALGDPRSVGMTPDHRQIVCCFHQEPVVAWADARRGHFRTFEDFGHEHTIAITPDGLGVVRNHYEAGTLDVRYFDNKRVGMAWFIGEEVVADAALTPDGRFMAARDCAGILHVWSDETGDTVLKQSLETGDMNEFHRVCVASDGRHVGVGWPESRVWSVETGKPVIELESGGAAAFTADGRGFVHSIHVSGRSEQQICIRDIETGEPVRTIDGHDDAVTALAVAPDNRLLISGGRDGIVKFWDLETGVLLNAVGKAAAG